jgi:hypothetical protein
LAFYLLLLINCNLYFHDVFYDFYASSMVQDYFKLLYMSIMRGYGGVMWI